MKHGTKKSITKKALLDELRVAYRAKGATLSSVDADHKRYGLRYKNAYVDMFGSWNEALRAAGLPVHAWKGGRTKGTPNNALRPAQQVETLALEEQLTRKIEQRRQEIILLEQLLNEVSVLKRENLIAS